MDEKIIGQENIDDGITLVDLFNALKKNIILLLLIGLVVVTLGIIYTWFMVTPMYTSKVNIQISNVNENVATVNQIKNNIKAIVSYDEIVEEVIHELDIPYEDIDATINSIIGRISSADVGSAAAVKITFEDKDPVQASRIVIALAEATARRVNIPKGIDGSLAFANETVELINKPRLNPDQAPSSPNKMLNIAISVILGGIIGIVIVILKEQFSSYFIDKKEVEKYTNISVIAMIPAKNGVKIGE